MYFTLLVKQLGNTGRVQWSPEFGDYERETVEGEIDSLTGSYCVDFDRFYKKSDFKIIATRGNQSAIDAKITALNSQEVI